MKWLSSRWSAWLGWAASLLPGVTMLIAYRQRSRHPLVVGRLGQLR